MACFIHPHTGDAPFYQTTTVVAHCHALYWAASKQAKEKLPVKLVLQHVVRPVHRPRHVATLLRLFIWTMYKKE